MDIYPCAKFHCDSFTGGLPPNMWNITLLWLFCCPVLSCPVLSSPVLSCPVLVILFFSRNSTQVEPLDGILPFWKFVIIAKFRIKLYVYYCFFVNTNRPIMLNITQHLLWENCCCFCRYLVMKLSHRVLTPLLCHVFIQCKSGVLAQSAKLK